MDTAVVIKCAGCKWMAVAGSLKAADGMYGEHLFSLPIRDEVKHPAICWMLMLDKG